MKVPPLNLTPEMNRVGMTLPFNTELLWRYPLAASSLQYSSQHPPPSSPLLDVKNQMPNHLAGDPRMWSRDDVSTFLRWFEREFDLPSIDLSKFCMNGKALCMLNKSDLADRAPGAGDILHNTLQFLLRDAPQMPHSPLTPHHPLLSPAPLTPTSAPPTVQPWSSLVSHDLQNFGHFLNQGGSVTLSPAPSVDSQSGGSPRHPNEQATAATHTTYVHTSSNSGGSTSSHNGSQSDSEDSARDSSSPQRSPLPPTSTASAFPPHTLASLKQFSEYRAAAAAAVAAVAARNDFDMKYQPEEAPQPQPQPPPVAPAPQPPQPELEPVETGTNGRLLWDFLQQLLNDPQQRYARYIAWKDRETGVFKIIDPPGLARLWGIQKNHLSMNYDKMSRALRYYYRVNILRKVQGERHCYQFLLNPSELKNIKNISMLRTTPAYQSQHCVKQESQQQSKQQQQQPAQQAPQNTHHSVTVIPPPSHQHPPVSQSSVQLSAASNMDDEGPTDLSLSSSHQHHSLSSSRQIDSEPQNLTMKMEEYHIETPAYD